MERKAHTAVLLTCTNKQSERGSSLNKRKSELSKSITTNHFSPSVGFSSNIFLYRLKVCIVNIKL